MVITAGETKQRQGRGWGGVLDGESGLVTAGCCLSSDY